MLVTDRKRADPQMHGGGHNACQGEDSVCRSFGTACRSRAIPAAYPQPLGHVKQEGHGDEPADPARRQVTRHGQLPVVTADDQQG